MGLTRRGFIGNSAATGAAIYAPSVARAATPNVVVIGGGAGGATAARYIARDSGGFKVTLIEPQRRYYTCFFSNLAIGGFWDFEATGHSYAKLASEYGVNVIHEMAIGIDRDAKTVRITSGVDIPYDRLIISPGIDFVSESVNGWSISDQNAMPHAFKGGTQAELLKSQVLAMPEGGTYVMVAPPNPYRCPPGPYERVSMVAHVLKQTNPTAKIIIADPKPKFSKMALFTEGWQNHYPGMIEWLGEDFGGGSVTVSPLTMDVDIDGELVEADVCNVIPAMKAGWIAEVAGLTNDAGWVPVNAADMSSKADPMIHVLGDAAQQGDMPKSGFSANSQAKVCAMAVIGALSSTLEDATKPAYSNICWSLIGVEDGVKVGASYKATEEKIERVEGFISQVGETKETRKQTFEESIDWYNAMTADMFG
ncbi:MAG: NAD(P)/FAD-dependent oxidoreductase [Pseudomonadota bacterium]